MPIEVVGSVPSQETVFRLRAKMEDNTTTIFEEGGGKVLAFRAKGDEIDMLRSLEYMSEFLSPESLEGADKVTIISDKTFEVFPSKMLLPKLETKKRDDDQLYDELREKLTTLLSPIVFTTENDILELYRTAIKLEGSYKRTNNSIGLDLMKLELPKEGELVYLVFEDGYRKLSRVGCERIVDEALASLREGPSLSKPGEQPLLSKETSAPGADFVSAKVEEDGEKLPADALKDPKVLIREFSKNMVGMGYRKDSMFSRHDANQIFFVGLSGPAVFFKYVSEEEDLSAFLRVLSHRRDAVGVLVSGPWSPELEAFSTRSGFIYLDMERAFRAHEVVKLLIKEGARS